MKRILLVAASAALLFAADEAIAPLGSYAAMERPQWEFQPRKDSAPPAFADAAGKAWVKTPVDAFILAGLRKAGLKPAPAADRATLIRRVTFDLTGLPPSPEEIEAFLADKSPKAWEKVVDRLSPASISSAQQTTTRTFMLLTRQRANCCGRPLYLRPVMRRQRCTKQTDVNSS
jgi:hypothetical protein